MICLASLGGQPRWLSLRELFWILGLHGRGESPALFRDCRGHSRSGGGALRRTLPEDSWLVEGSVRSPVLDSGHRWCAGIWDFPARILSRSLALLISRVPRIPDSTFRMESSCRHARGWCGNSLSLHRLPRC